MQCPPGHLFYRFRGDCLLRTASEVGLSFQFRAHFNLSDVWLKECAELR